MQEVFKFTFWAVLKKNCKNANDHLGAFRDITVLKCFFRFLKKKIELNNIQYSDMWKNVRFCSV